MKFREPKIEFISIDLSVATTSEASCGEAAAQGGDRCVGDGPHSKCIGCEDVSAKIA